MSNIPIVNEDRRASNKSGDFNRFIKTCKDELKSGGFTTCFTLEQVNALALEFDITYKEMNGYFSVSLKEVK